MCTQQFGNVKYKCIKFKYYNLGFYLFIIVWGEGPRGNNIY